MGRGISRMARKELLGTIRDRYQHSTRKDKGRILDEFTAAPVTGLHRKHAIRLLTQSNDQREHQPSLSGRRIYDEAVREAVIVVWEASRRPHLRQAPASPDRRCPGSLGGVHGAPRSPAVLDSLVRERLLTASASTLDRLLKPSTPPVHGEFTAVTGLHRKHAIRLLTQSNDQREHQPSLSGRRIYDEAVREAVIVVWEASDRICGKRLHAALPHLVESMERHGHLQLDSLVRERLLTASASTLDRLKPSRLAVGAVGSPWDTGFRYGPTTTGTSPHRATWRSTWWPTAAVHCRVPSSTAWW